MAPLDRPRRAITALTRLVSSSTRVAGRADDAREVTRLERSTAWWSRLALAAVIGLAAANFLWQLGSSSYYVDEIQALAVSLHPISGLLHAIANDEITPPAYFAFLHEWTGHVGTGPEWVTRLPSALCGVALVGAVYWLASVVSERRLVALGASQAERADPDARGVEVRRDLDLMGGVANRGDVRLPRRQEPGLVERCDQLCIRGRTLEVATCDGVLDLARRTEPIVHAPMCCFYRDGEPGELALGRRIGIRLMIGLTTRQERDKGNDPHELTVSTWRAGLGPSPSTEDAHRLHALRDLCAARWSPHPGSVSPCRAGSVRTSFWKA